MAKQKYYVVWKGKNTGIFNNWEDCKEQVHGVEWAKYMSFEKKEEAEMAYKNDYTAHIRKNVPAKKSISEEDKKKYGIPLQKSICVDGARNTTTGFIEYQWVETDTQKSIFRKWPFADGTNNIAEFLWIVHALAYCKERNIEIPIYSDSRNAIAWIKAKECKTKQEKTEKNKELFDLIERAILWLKNNTYKNKILKWETKVWWENPADFGRK